MAVYVVMEPPGLSPEARSHDTDATTFVRDGFSWLGFLVPPLWLLWHRLWIEAALAFVVLGFLSALGEALGLVPAGVLLVLLVMLAIGLEGQALRIAALGRRGWKQWGVVVANDLDDADTRYAMTAGETPENPLHEPPVAPEPVLARPVLPRPSIGLVPFSARPYPRGH